MTCDFSPRHLVNVGETAVAYRLGPFERFQETWYPRLDFASPARFVSEHAARGPGVRVVVENLPPSSYYLEGEHAIYYIREGARFSGRAARRARAASGRACACSARRESWREYTGSALEVWLVREIERFPLLPEPEQVWGDRLLEQTQAYVSQDGRIEVLHIRLAPSAGEARGAAS